MDIVMIILRLIHIFAGIIWVGGGVIFTFFIAPTVASLGPDGGKFMKQFFTGTRYTSLVPTVAGLTVLSGLIMYYRVSAHFNADWMKSSSGVVLSIGSLAGILAAGHGGAILGRTASRLKALMEEMGSNPPTPEQGAELQQLQAKMRANAPISLVLMIITVAGMASARYF